jgi:hypothetical protein
MMKERELRKKLLDLGLSGDGGKQVGRQERLLGCRGGWLGAGLRGAGRCKA